MNPSRLLATAGAIPPPSGQHFRRQPAFSFIKLWNVVRVLVVFGRPEGLAHSQPSRGVAWLDGMNVESHRPSLRLGWPL
jgi:hypothetical protein